MNKALLIENKSKMYVCPGELNSAVLSFNMDAHDERHLQRKKRKIKKRRKGYVY